MSTRDAWITGGPVGQFGVLTQTSLPHRSCRATENCSHEADASDHLMLPSSEQSQHARGIVGVSGLREKLPIHNDNRVGAENDILRTLAPHRQSFFTRQPLGTVFCGFARQRRFVDVGRFDRERKAGVTKKFVSARRSGSEHKHTVRIVLGIGV